MKVDWKTPARIEHKVAEIIARQERAGWPFRIDQAKAYVEQLDAEAAEIYEQIKATMGYYYERKSEVKAPFKKDGRLTKIAAEYGDVGGPFTRIEWHPIELSQHQKVAQRLVQLGWVPTQYSSTGIPKIKPDGEPCPNLERMEQSDIGHTLAHYTKLTHRSNQIKGWIDSCRYDGRVPACANPNGTNTGRMTHKVVANVPKASPDVFFGTEMRSLFTHRGEGYKVINPKELIHTREFWTLVGHSVWRHEMRQSLVSILLSTALVLARLRQSLIYLKPEESPSLRPWSRYFRASLL